MQREQSNENTPTVSVVDRVLHGIINDIISGKIQPGDRLPTEPELCVAYEAGRNSVREAIKKLEAYGVVYIRRADGTYISDHYNQNMLDPMLYHILLSGSDWVDIIELSQVIETGILHGVIARGLDEQTLRQFRQTLSDLESAFAFSDPQVQEIAQLDAQFHMLMATVLQIPQMTIIVSCVSRLTFPLRTEVMEGVIARREGDRMVSMHRRMLHLMEHHKAEGIEQIIAEHYSYWK